jgi:hypothetical protein
MQGTTVKIMGVLYLCKQLWIGVSLDVKYEVMDVALKISGCCHFRCEKSRYVQVFRKKKYLAFFWVGDENVDTWLSDYMELHFKRKKN